MPEAPPNLRTPGASVLRRTELPGQPISRRFEGAQYGDIGVSLYWMETLYIPANAAPNGRIRPEYAVIMKPAAERGAPQSVSSQAVLLAKVQTSCLLSEMP